MKRVDKKKLGILMKIKIEVTGRHHSVLKQVLGDYSHYEYDDLHSDAEETGAVNDEEEEPTNIMGKSREGGLFEERGASDPDRNQPL